METTKKTFRQKVDQILTMLKPDFDWDKHYEQDDPDDLDDLVRECAIVGWPEGEEAKKYLECGSAEVQSTPAALYRLLYLLKPKSVDFSGMYKTHLFGIFSDDKAVSGGCLPVQIRSRLVLLLPARGFEWTR
jgi:hypothetical protein